MNQSSLLVLVLVALLQVATSEDIYKPRIVFMDHNAKTGNFLFRGNEPKISNSSGSYFAWDLLRQFMQEQASMNKIQFPNKYYLIDIKLIYWHDPLEEPDIVLEQDFFKANPTLGESRMLQIFGDLSPPTVYPESYVKEEALALSSWQHDDLPKLIPALKSMVNTPRADGVPTIIYFHCECGCDRTGEVAGSYAMKYLNFTYGKAYEWDDSIAGRWILPNHDFALQWYCEYLRYAENMNVHPCSLPL